MGTLMGLVPNFIVKRNTTAHHDDRHPQEAAAQGSHPGRRQVRAIGRVTSAAASHPCSCSVGKTSLMQRYVKGGYKEGYKATIGMVCRNMNAA
jgi:glycine cleavage system aminomethyltransferase T